MQHSSLTVQFDVDSLLDTVSPVKIVRAVAEDIYVRDLDALYTVHGRDTVVTALGYVLAERANDCADAAQRARWAQYAYMVAEV